MGRVSDHLHARLREGPVHLTLLDPEKSAPGEAARMAREAVALGTHAIMIGGSTGVSPGRIGAIAKAIRATVSVPTIIFPEGTESLTAEADAIYFMSLLNSRDLDFVIRRHARASLLIRSMGIEPIPLGYLVIAPGMRVGEVGHVDPIARDDLTGAQGYALAAEYLGMQFVYLEAGSGAPSPVPAEMVRAVRSVLSIPLIVGGGIRTAMDARCLLNAGAQMIVTGTIAERKDTLPRLAEILQEVRRSHGH